MLAALGLSPLANARAYSINCGSPQGFQSFGRDVTVRAQGVWESLGFDHTRLNYQLQLAVGCERDGACWAKAEGSGKGAVANQDYEPIRYQDFQQFSLDPIAGLERGFLLLPTVVPEVKGSFRAYAMLDTGSFGATVPLLCRGEPVTSSGSSVSESAAAEIARADRIIQDEFGFPSLRLLANAESLEKELKSGSADTVSVSQATQLAMAVIFDSFDAIEAPLNIAADGWASTHEQRLSHELTRDQKTAARQFLREQMQDPRTSLALHLGGIIKGQDYPPEQGESTQDNWIFVLHIPTLSDHLYWVIVDRRGSKAPYLYGFN
jgi:hypothetical protein